MSLLKTNISAALKTWKCNSKIAIAREAKNETKMYLEYEIEF